MALAAAAGSAVLLSARPAPVVATTPPGELVIESVPPGAAVSLDGEPRGVTPARVATEPGGGTYRVGLRLPGYQSVERLVSVPSGAQERLSLVLEPLPARLAVDSIPSGAEVELDGRAVGKAPLVLPDLPPGRHRVVALLPGFGPRGEELELVPGADERRLLRLDPLPASLEVHANVEGATVMLNGEVRGTSPLRLDGLASATYELRVEHAGLREWVGYVWLGPGDTRSVSVDLAPRQLVAHEPPAPSHGIAVIVENQADARPQSGLHRADIVYEALAEGGISRFLALYLTGEAEVIGPVRSARHYFVHWAREYDAALTHIGASPQGFDALARSGIPSLDETRGGGAIWRSRQRFAPHNAYTSTAGIAAALGQRLPTGAWGGLRFKEPDWRYSGEGAPELSLRYWFDYQVAYRYDAERNRYLRFMVGVPHRDLESGEQLWAASVVVLHMPAQVIDSAGRLDMALTGSGRADYFLDGVHLAGSWRREALAAPTRYLDAEGNEVHFNPGPLWIQVVPSNARLEY